MSCMLAGFYLIVLDLTAVKFDVVVKSGNVGKDHDMKADNNAVC